MEAPFCKGGGGTGGSPSPHHAGLVCWGRGGRRSSLVYGHHGGRVQQSKPSSQPPSVSGDPKTWSAFSPPGEVTAVPVCLHSLPAFPGWGRALCCCRMAPAAPAGPRWPSQPGLSLLRAFHDDFPTFFVSL